MAKKDKRIVLICVDQDVGLAKMADEMPGQYFMEGISEANITGVASGLAADGLIPHIVNHASFLTRRPFEQIVLDTCLQERNVRFIGMGGGLATAHLGPTHTVIEDMSVMRAVPNMTVMAPCDADEMRRLLPVSADWAGPMYIRLARYGKPIVSQDENGFEIGKAILLRRPPADGKHVLLISTGAMTNRAVSAANELAASGIECAVLHVHTIKPLDREAICAHAAGASLVVTMEENVLNGGFGSACLEALVDGADLFGSLPPIHRIGLPDKFVHEYGTQESLFDAFGLETHHVVKTVTTCAERLGIRSLSLSR
jgi:transketolase